MTLVPTILGSSTAILDSSVVNVALPSIQRNLGGGLAGEQWVSKIEQPRLGWSDPAVTGSLIGKKTSLPAFRLGVEVATALVVIGGLIGAAGIRNPRRVVIAKQCPGGQLAGAPLDAAGLHSAQAT